MTEFPFDHGFLQFFAMWAALGAVAYLLMRVRLWLSRPRAREEFEGVDLLDD
jgi:hypothetical protein